MLELTVFFCGAITMILELVGSRVFAPYLGASLYIWTSLIGVVLASLSVGYWVGGYAADRGASTKKLSAIIFAAGLCVLLVGFFSDFILLLIQHWTSQLRVASVIAATILFAGPCFFLGMVLPYAIRLKITRVEHSGRTTGTLYALSTLGSILGTFLTGFVLLAYFGTNQIVFGVSAALLALSLWLSFYHLPPVKIVLFILSVLCAWQSAAMGELWKGSDFIDTQTAYNRVWIYPAVDGPSNRPIRVMQVNEENDSAMFTDDRKDELVFKYTNFFRLAEHFRPNFKRVLLIGGAAFTVPKYFFAHYPGIQMDVAEIDPGIVDLAKKYFELQERADLKIILEDARTYLNRAHERYDVILGDAFKSYSAPFQLTTKEAVKHLYDNLADDGVALINIVGSIEGPSGQFLRAQLRTFKLYFPKVYVLACHEPDNGTYVQNLMLVALKSPARVKFQSPDLVLNGFLQRVWIADIPEDKPVLTDDFAPVDSYNEPIVKELWNRRSNPLWARVKRFTGARD